MSTAIDETYCNDCGTILEPGQVGLCDECRPDLELNAEQLDCKYNPDGDGEHPEHTRLCWREEVAQSNTLRGYWDWVESEIWQTAHE